MAIYKSLLTVCVLQLFAGERLCRASSLKAFVVRSEVNPLITMIARGGARRSPQRFTSSPLGVGREYQTAPSDKTRAKQQIEDFLTRDSRNTFISRVYAILSGQLLVTVMSIILFGKTDLGQWMRQGGNMVPTISLILSSISWYFICSSPKARRQSPTKWQLLTLFTLGESIAVGYVSSFFRFATVLSAMMATSVAAVGVSAYTILNRNSKYDLSQWGAGLSSCVLIFLVYSLIHVLELYGILPQGFLPYREGIFSFCGACLFSAFLAYDTKLIVGGKHSKFQMNEKDYVFGAMSLYSDIINVFIYLLRFIGEDD